MKLRQAVEAASFYVRQKYSSLSRAGGQNTEPEPSAMDTVRTKKKPLTM